MWNQYYYYYFDLPKIRVDRARTKKKLSSYFWINLFVFIEMTPNCANIISKHGQRLSRNHSARQGPSEFYIFYIFGITLSNNNHRRKDSHIITVCSCCWTHLTQFIAGVCSFARPCLISWCLLKNKPINLCLTN